MEDKDKRNATKHYQNSDYPSGSFEAAINADQQDRLREGSGLRLERHPLRPDHSGADIEEMVPAFMHRDFFRSEEGAVGAVGSSRLRAARREAGKDAPEEVSKELPGKAIDDNAKAEPAALARPAYMPPPDTEGYMEPPTTEEDPPARPSVPTSAEPSPYARPPAPPQPARATSARTEAPRPDTTRSETARPEPVRPNPVTPKAEETLPPLRSGDSNPAPDPRVTAPPLRGESARPASAPPAAQPEPVAAAPAAQPAAPNYSIPMLVALAMILGVFVWRENSRRPVVAQDGLPIPVTVASPAAPTPMPEPTVAGVGFRPTYMAVGPAVPQGMTEEEGGSASPTPGGDEAGLFPGGEGVSEEEADDRSAILDRMSQAPPVADSTEPPDSSDDGGGLFPVQNEESEVPVRAKAPVKEAAPKPVAVVKPKPAAKPAAPKPAAVKPAAKPTAAKPKAVPVATAADLFPIDDEVPIRSSKPKPAAPVSAPVQVAAPVSAPPADGYQIDEPNL